MHYLLDVLENVFRRYRNGTLTTPKTKLSIKDFFSKCDQIRRFLGIWSHLLKKSLMENFILCAATDVKWVEGCQGG